MIGIIWFAVWTLSCGFMQSGIGVDIGESASKGQRFGSVLIWLGLTARAMSGIGAAASIPSAIGERPLYPRPGHRSLISPLTVRHHRGEFSTRPIPDSLLRGVWRWRPSWRFHWHDSRRRHNRISLVAASLLDSRRNSSSTTGSRLARDSKPRAGDGEEQPCGLGRCCTGHRRPSPAPLCPCRRQ